MPMEVRIVQEIGNNNVWITKPDIISLFHPARRVRCRNVTFKLHLRGFPRDAPMWNGIDNQVQVSMVRKRSSIIVSKHGCCPKLHEPVYMRLWHLILREQKFCGLKFDTIHKGIPVILPRSISRSGQGTWREIISIPVCWCSYAFEIISNAMRIVLPSRMG